MLSRVAAILLALPVLTWACGGESTPAATPTATPTTTPTPQAAAQTTTPGLAYEGTLRTGIWVRVAGAGDCLEFRVAPSAEGYSPVNFCQPDGFEGYIAAGPTFSDGRWWWAVAGLGWAVEDFLTFAREEDLSTRVVSGLEGLGKIAYVGADGDLWVTNADGSERQRLVDIEAGDEPGKGSWIGPPRWSPDGRRILFDVSSYEEGQERRFSVRIVDLSGRLVREIPDAASAFWSPDGERLSYLHDIQRIELGAMLATPVVFDLETGERQAIGPTDTYLEGAKWRPNSGELVYEDSDGIHLAQADGSGERLIATDPQSLGRTPNWAPDGSRLALLSLAQDCAGYLVYRVEGDTQELCVPTPPPDPGRGGRGGTVEDGQTDWSPDGRLFAYHTEWATANLSGVYVVDAQTGDQTPLPGWKASYVSFAPDSRHVVFRTDDLDFGPGFIWIGDIETGQVILLAEGTLPAWQP